MKYSIIINPSSKKSQAIQHAYKFVQAILQQQYTTIQVFFYGYAVESIFFNDLWNDIDKSINLIACSTIAEQYIKQGLKPANNINIAGLGQWVEASISADKRIEFV